MLFQPHVDLEKTSGGGASTEEPAASLHTNSVSQSQDSEAAGFEAITAEEPFRGYSFEVSFFSLSSLPMAFVRCPRRQLHPFLPFFRVLFVTKDTIFAASGLTYHHTLSLPDLGRVGITMFCLRK